MDIKQLREDVFPMIREDASWAEEESTERWIVALDDAVGMYSEEYNLDLSIYDFLSEFMNWFSKQQ